MKAALLFLLLVCICVSLSAQTKVLVVDSTFTSDDGTNYQFSTRQQHDYNRQCKDSFVDISFANIPEHSALLNEYYTDNSLYRTTNQNGDGNGEYLNSTRETFTYTSTKTLSTITTDHWNTLENTWETYVRTLYVYDANGFLTSDSAQVWDPFNNIWQSNSFTTYYNNASGRADSSLSGYIASDLYNKTFYSYTSSGRLQQQLLYFYTGGSLENVTRTTYTHDSTNYVSADSIITEYAAGTNPTNFKINNIIIIQNTYNTDGTVNAVAIKTSFIFGNTSQDSYAAIHYHYETCDNGVLPLTLVNFEGKQQNNNALLYWQTTNETNTAYFTIQRSIDGIHFKSIGKVTAWGNSAVQKNYTYTDANITTLATTKLYYRLAITDLDGKATNSVIAGINIATANVSVYISPVPVQNAINIYSVVSMPDAFIRVTDMAGRLLYSSRQTLTAGGRVTVDASRFARGIYTVTVESKSGKLLFRIIK